ncbi:MAG: hypothetical protein ACXQT3_06060 [Methermicoccaceae archaeon]
MEKERYIVIARYSSEPEKKRIDYLTDKWSHCVRKVDGAVLLVEGSPDGFMEELLSRIDEGSVGMFSVRERKLDVEQQRETMDYTFQTSSEALEGFVGYLMGKLRGAFSHSAGEMKVYEVYTKKGRARVSISIKEGTDATHISALVEGYGEGVPFVAERIRSELELFGGIQDVVERG